MRTQTHAKVMHEDLCKLTEVQKRVGNTLEHNKDVLDGISSDFHRVLLEQIAWVMVELKVAKSDREQLLKELKLLCERQSNVLEKNRFQQDYNQQLSKVSFNSSSEQPFNLSSAVVTGVNDQLESLKKQIQHQFRTVKVGTS